MLNAPTNPSRGLQPARTLDSLDGPHYGSLALRVRTVAFLTSFAAASAPAVAQLNHAQFQERVAALKDRVVALAGDGSDYLDTLYFGWFDRPYARATLAILVKVVATLEREAESRANGDKSIDDETVESILRWVDDALSRVVRSKPENERDPFRARITWGALINGQLGPLYAFIDGTQATPRNPALGDLDILAALGQRVYSCNDPSNSKIAQFQARALRAEALGVMVADRVPPGVAGHCASCLLNNMPRWPDQNHRLVGIRFRHLERTRAGGNLEPLEFPAVIDDHERETFSASLARRAALRGATNRTTYAAVSWTPPTWKIDSTQALAATRAAMWMHALDGQRLALVDSWLDPEGDPTHERAVLIDPALAETIAHSSLDMLRLGKHVIPFTARPRVALVVRDDVFAQEASAGDTPRVADVWAGWVLQVWETLISRQIQFDVVSETRGREAVADYYPVVFPLRIEHAADTQRLIEKLERRLAQDVEHVNRLTAREMDGTVARDVFLRRGEAPNGKACVGIVNISERARVLKLRGRPPVGPSKDVISEELIPAPNDRVVFGPWQVRLLWPE